MSVPVFLFTLKSKGNLSICVRLFILIVVYFFNINKGVANNQNGHVTDTFLVDWNGSDFLVTGNGLSSTPFPTLSLYESNYYIFKNISSGEIRFSIGDDNVTEYNKTDVWNNGAYSNDEYLLFSPDSNSSRTLYYFNPENNSTVGEINISEYDSLLIHPQINVASLKFGQSTVINDWNQTIIGSTGEGSTDDGAFHIFNMEVNGSYSYLEKISPPVSDQLGQFGYSLGVDNNLLLVGSPDENSFTGYVYSYIRESNGSYTLQQTLNSYSTTGDSFGWDISVSGEYLAVSSLQANNSGSGKVSILEHNGTDWILGDILSADDNQSDDEFGYSIQLSSTRLLAGAPQATANEDNSGAAYIFERNASGWFQTAKLSPSSLSTGDEFGYSVALVGDLAFVGARQKDGNAIDAGAVYVFRLNGLNWEEISIIYPPQDEPNQYFSSDLKVHADILAVSSPRLGEGHTYIYRMENNGTNISLISNLNLIEANSTDQSHLSVALADGFGVIGIPGDSTYANTGGGALVFYNDAWQALSLPAIAPIIDRNSSVLFSIDEDSGTFLYDFNSSFPYDLNLTWSLSISPSSGANFDMNSSTGLFQYTPDGNFSGNHEFTANLAEGSLYDSIDFNVTVNPSPDPPIFTTQALSYSMEGDDYNQSILVFDADGDALVLSCDSLPPGLSIVGHNIVGVPASGTANGASFHDYNATLSVTDNWPPAVNKTFSLRVLKRNNPPQIFVDGNASVFNFALDLDEDINATTWYQSLPVLGYNDSDGHQLELNASVLPSHGSLVLDLNATDLNQSILYTPNLNYTGLDTFTIRLRDVEGEGNKSSQLTFNLNVNPINDSPQFEIVNRNLTASEGIFFEHNFSFYDPDENDTHSLSFINLPSWLEYDNNFTISQTPTWTDYPEGGSSNFLATVSDQNGSTDSFLFILQVVPNNFPPLISPSGNFNISLDEDETSNEWSSPNISVSDSDTVLSELNWIVETNASHGILTLSGSVGNPQIDYIPDANYTGTDFFSLLIVDSNDTNSSDTISFNLVINPIDDPPVFESNVSFTTAVVGYDWNYTFSYFDSDSLNGVVVSSNQLPNWLNLFNLNSSTGYVRGVPTFAEEGNHTVSLQVFDPDNLSDIQTFVIEVIQQNNPPVFTQGSSINVNINEDSTLDLKQLISVQDPDNQKLIWSSLVQPSNGQLVIKDESGYLSILNYVPDANFSGPDSFELQVSDGIDYDTISVSININPLEDRPVFVYFPSQLQIVDHEGLDLNVSFFDADGFQGVTASVLINSSTGDSSWLSTNTGAMNSGIISLNGFPSENDEGNYSITLTVVDSADLNVTRTSILEVLVLNKSPIINEGNSSISVSMVEDSQWVTPVLWALDQETNSSNLSWSILSLPSHGVASIDSSGANFTYSVDSNFSGTDSFSVLVEDDGVPISSISKSDSIDIQISVESVNDDPVFTSNPVVMWNDESDYVYEIRTFDSDSLAGSTNLELISVLPEWLTFRNDGNGSGSLTGSPSNENIGKYNIELKVIDFNGSTAMQVFTLEIVVDNYLPEIKTTFGNLLSKTRIYAYEDTINDFTKILSFSASDLESAPESLSWSLLGQSISGGSVQIEGNGSVPVNFTYLPPANFTGEDSFSISVSDGERNSSLAITVFVIPISDNPQLANFPSEITVKEGEYFNQSISSLDFDNSNRFLVLNGINGVDDWLRVVEINNVEGSVVIGGIPSFGTANSSRIVSVRVVDSTGLTSDFLTELKMKIIPHDIVQTNSIGPISMNEDQNGTILELNDFFIDKFINSNIPLLFDGNSSNTELVKVALFGSNLSLYPQANMSGNCSIQLSIKSGSRVLYSEFSVSVLPVDDPPFNKQNFPYYSLPEDSPLTTLSLNTYFEDIDSDFTLFKYKIVSLNEDVLSARILNQTISFSPKPNQSGATSVGIEIDSSGLKAVTDLNITIHPINDPPEIISDIVINQTISEDLSPLNWVPLTVNAKDVEADPLSWQVIVKPEHGSHSFISGITGETVQINYMPHSNYFGQDSMIIEVSDGVLSDQVEVRVNIEAVDDSPFISKQIPTINLVEDSLPYRLSLGDYFSDLDNNDSLIQFSVKSTDPNLILVELQESNLMLYPQLNQSGNSFISVDINSNGMIFTTFINVIITSVDDSPYLTHGIPDQILVSGNNRMINLKRFFDDIDSSGISFKYSAFSSKTDLVNLSIVNSVLRIESNNNELGNVQITVELNSSGLLVQDQFEVTVLDSKDINYSEENISLFFSNSVGTEFENWKSNWFGYFTILETNWIFHSDLGWIFPRPSSDLNQMWFWIDSMGWLWTSSEYWQHNGSGYLFSIENNGWLYFQSDKINQSKVYDYLTDTWSLFKNKIQK